MVVGGFDSPGQLLGQWWPMSCVYSIEAVLGRLWGQLWPMRAVVVVVVVVWVVGKVWGEGVAAAAAEKEKTQERWWLWWKRGWGCRYVAWGGGGRGGEAVR